MNQYYGSCVALKDYFYAFWSGFNYNYDTAQSTKDKVDRAKKYAAAAKKYEDDGMPTTAEIEIKKIIPILL